MKSSVEVCINQDNNLIIKIDEIDYLFAETDYLTSDRGKILLKHQAIMDLAKRADVTVEEPKLLSSHSPVVYVFSRKAVRKGKETFTAIGECNNKTLFDDIMLQNPASTADNRAVEKAILSVLGLHGKVYGATEINFKDKILSDSKKKQEKTEDIQKALESTSFEKEEVEDVKKPFWWDDLGKDRYSDKQLIRFLSQLPMETIRTKTGRLNSYMNLTMNAVDIMPNATNWKMPMKNTENWFIRVGVQFGRTE